MIYRYILVSPEGHEEDFEYENYLEAEREARRLGYAVVERHYEYVGSELAWTPNGETTWPQED